MYQLNIDSMDQKPKDRKEHPLIICTDFSVGLCYQKRSRFLFYSVIESLALASSDPNLEAASRCSWSMALDHETKSMWNVGVGSDQDCLGWFCNPAPSAYNVLMQIQGGQGHWYNHTEALYFLICMSTKINMSL